MKRFILLCMFLTACSHLEKNTNLQYANAEWYARKTILAELQEAVSHHNLSCNPINTKAELPTVYYGDGHLLARNCPQNRSGTVVAGCYVPPELGNGQAKIYVLLTGADPTTVLVHEYKHHFVRSSRLSKQCLEEIVLE